MLTIVDNLFIVILHYMEQFYAIMDDSESKSGSDAELDKSATTTAARLRGRYRPSAIFAHPQPPAGAQGVCQGL